MADGRQHRANVLDEKTLGLVVGEINGGLNDVVGEGVADEPVKLRRHDDLLHDHTHSLLARATDALLDDVRAEFLLGEIGNAAEELMAQRLGEARLGEVEDILHHIVAERILNHRLGVADDVVDECTLLQTLRMVNATLEHAAAMTMRTDSDAVDANSTEDELCVVG